MTLATWRISRKEATDTFPWGYSKFETFGTLSVSIILGQLSSPIPSPKCDGADWDSGRSYRDWSTFIPRKHHPLLKYGAHPDLSSYSSKPCSHSSNRNRPAHHFLKSQTISPMVSHRPYWNYSTPTALQLLNILMEATATPIRMLRR